MADRQPEGTAMIADLVRMLVILGTMFIIAHGLEVALG